ncbi:hypothetical protein GCM10010191_29890 [Actinomadura vinacea]|uniref:Uncharacterized protein n=1 Tax=Actinomadura vinacea TaxID=115336 RepID=A0ABN3J0G2_9ACTN
MATRTTSTDGPNAATVIAALHRGEKRLVFCDSLQLVEELGAALRRYDGRPSTDLPPGSTKTSCGMGACPAPTEEPVGGSPSGRNTPVKAIGHPDILDQSTKVLALRVSPGISPGALLIEHMWNGQHDAAPASADVTP